MKNRLPLNAAWIGWIVVSLAVLAHLALLNAIGGAEAIGALTPRGPFSKFWLTVFAVLYTWLLGGLLLWLLKTGRLHKDNALTWAGFFLILLLYLNLLRERVEYGDLESYILGATNLYHGQPFDNLYIYPPLWAILLKPLVPHGENAFLYATWNLNVWMLAAFYFLLIKVLERYGFSARLAAAVTILFMLLNMPLLRTLYYLQVNLHVLNLIFISLLVYPRSRWLSALALALAIHLKMSPAALVLAFLLERDWRWLGWLALFTFGIFGLTVLSDGLQPYLSYVANVRQLDEAHAVTFRETSFDSFFWALAQLYQLQALLVRILIYLCKAGLAIASFVVMARAASSKSYHDGQAARLMNAIPPLLILMTMFSPLVWEHHAVFLVIPLMVLLRGLETPAEWTGLGVIYFIEYLVPTIDFFPWSYLRLLAPLFMLWLLWRAAIRPGPTPLFGALNRWLGELPGLRV